MTLTGLYADNVFFLSEITKACYKIPLKLWIMFFLLPGETSTERTVYVGVLPLGIFVFAMETQHTDAVSIANTSKVKNGTHFFFLPRIKKSFLRYLQRGHRRQKKLQWQKAVKVAWSTDARETKNNRSVKLQKLYMHKKNKQKKSSYWTNDTDYSHEAIWLVYFRHTLDAQ